MPLLPGISFVAMTMIYARAEIFVMKTVGGEGRIFCHEENVLAMMAEALSKRENIF